MTPNLIKRIEKLEVLYRRDGEVLLLWIQPGEDVPAAASAANKAGLFDSGDMVMCAECGEDPIPKPKWLKRDGALFRLLSEQEDRCITAMLKKRIETVDALVAADEPAEVAGLARPMPHDLSELSSVDLMHIALGVKT
jgi:hypothetical protein